MTFNKLIKWREWTYLATMSNLWVFDSEGNKVAEWFYVNQTRYCAVETLPADIAMNFAISVLDFWSEHVETRLKECESMGRL